MTTIATIVAMIPLLIAVGPGAESRFQIGLIISTGLGFGTIFTLFVVPVFYIILSQKKCLGKLKWCFERLQSDRSTKSSKA